MHLLCDSGDYNTCYLEKYLPGEDLVILTVAGREQGIVSKDGIGIDDLKGQTVHQPAERVGYPYPA